MHTFFMKLSCNSLGDCRDISYLAFVLLKLFSCLQWMIEISANILCTRCLALVQKLNRHLHKHTNCTQLWSFEQKGIHIRCTKSWISQIALLVFCIVRNLSIYFLLWIQGLQPKIYTYQRNYNRIFYDVWVQIVS